MPEEIQKPSRKRRVSSGTKPTSKRHRKSGAVLEVDKQLTNALQQRSAVGRRLLEMAGLQDRYNRLTQEINELLNMQARMNGQAPSVPQANTLGTTYNSVTVPFAVGAPIPPGAGSIPANPKPIAPLTANAADEVSSEGGWQ